MEYSVFVFYRTAAACLITAQSNSNRQLTRPPSRVILVCRVRTRGNPVANASPHAEGRAAMVLFRGAPPPPAPVAPLAAVSRAIVVYRGAAAASASAVHQAPAVARAVPVAPVTLAASAADRRPSQRLPVVLLWTSFDPDLSSTLYFRMSIRGDTFMWVVDNPDGRYSARLLSALCCW